MFFCFERSALMSVLRRALRIYAYFCVPVCLSASVFCRWLINLSLTVTIVQFVIYKPNVQSAVHVQNQLMKEIFIRAMISIIRNVLNQASPSLHLVFPPSHKFSWHLQRLKDKVALCPDKGEGSSAWMWMFSHETKAEPAVFDRRGDGSSFGVSCNGAERGRRKKTAVVDEGLPSPVGHKI